EPERLRGAARPVGLAPAVMKVKGRAVVDEKELFVPNKEVRIARGAVDVGDEGVEEQDARGELGARKRAANRGEGDRAGEVVEADVHAHARFEQVRDVRIGL